MKFVSKLLAIMIAFGGFFLYANDLNTSGKNELIKKIEAHYKCYSLLTAEQFSQISKGKYLTYGDVSCGVGIGKEKAQMEVLKVLSPKGPKIVSAANRAFFQETAEYYRNENVKMLTLKRIMSFTFQRQLDKIGIKIHIPQISAVKGRESNAFRHYYLTYELMKNFDIDAVNLILGSHEAGEFSFDSLIDSFNNRLAIADLQQFNLLKVPPDYIVARAVELIRAHYFILNNNFESMELKRPVEREFYKFVTDLVGPK